MKRTLIFCTSLFFILSLVACYKSKKEEEVLLQTEKPIKIGFSIDTFVIERWRRDCDVFIASAKEYGAEVIVQNAGNSVEEQIKQIQYLIDIGVDVLVIVPKNANSLSDVIKKAGAKNIPVISYDRLICDADISLYMSINSRSVGYLMASALLDLSPRGIYFCIYGSKDDYNMTLIDNGVREAFDGKQTTINYVYYTDDWNYDLSYKKMNELLDENRVPDVVICGNDAIAETVIRSLSEHRLGNKVLISGQDADIAACRRILDGTQTLTVYKPITELARLAAVYACRLALGEKPEAFEEVDEIIDNNYKNVPVFWLEPILVTRENLKEVIIDSGFHTEQEIYRK
ncbi:MAG: substrate-binding domain-containing protein [Spirochaetota bacterium]|nr:substrate-binding domain-containing protein [Spirochaetota bacterium]